MQNEELEEKEREIGMEDKRRKTEERNFNEIIKKEGK